jgi:hypothetical protein
VADGLGLLVSGCVILGVITPGAVGGAVEFAVGRAACFDEEVGEVEVLGFGGEIGEADERELEFLVAGGRGEGVGAVETVSR